MIQTLSTLVDSHHFFHPKEQKEKFDHDQPTLFRRIAGIVIVALSIPLTLGIATGIFAYFAQRKVVHLEKQNRSDLDQCVEAAFGKAVEGKEPLPVQGTFEGAVRALQKGEKKELMAKVSEIDEDDLTKEMKNALIAAAIAYDRVDELDQLWDEFGTVYIPLHEVKSPEMVARVIEKIVDAENCINRPGENGNTALHNQHNLDVVKALTEREARYLRNAEGYTSLDLCTDPKIAEHLIDHFGLEVLNTPNGRDRIPLLTNNNVDVLRVIIQKMPDITVPLNKKGHTILHYFTLEPLKNHPELIHDVLKRFDTEEERMAFVNSSSPEISPILYFYDLPLEVVKAVVEAGALYEVEADSDTPLHSCTNPEIAEFFIEKFGKDILEKTNSGGRTPLMTVKNPEVQKLLIDKGAKVDVVETKYRMNAMFFAKSVEVARILVEKGVDPNALDLLDGNALFGPITPEVANWLIEIHGLKVDQKDNDGKEAIHYIGEDNISMAKVLIGDRTHTHNWGGDLPPIMGNRKFLEWLRQGKPD